MDSKHKHLVYEVAKNQLDQQIASIDAFTTRAALVLATCGVVFAGYLQLLSSELWIFNCHQKLFVFEIGAVILAGLFAFLALVFGSEKEPWRYDPNPEKLYQLAERVVDLDIEDEVTKSMIESYNHNRTLFEKKYRYLGFARYALYCSVGIFMVHLLSLIL